MTPEQLAARLEQQGDKLTARAVRDILRIFRDVDTRLLLAQVLSAMQAQSPTQRLAAREQLLAIARSIYPSLPDSLTALTAQAASAGAQAGAGMILQAAPFVQPALAEVAQEMGAIVRAAWQTGTEQHVARTASIITRALTSGGRYPIARELQDALSISRRAAQGLAGDMVLTAASVAQARVVEKAVAETDAKVYARWVSAQDKRVRREHQRLNGRQVEQGKTFVTGITLRFPRDPSCNDPRQTRRCRCTVTYSIDE